MYKRKFEKILLNLSYRGPFITALGKIWCPDHFVCVRPECKRPLQDIGFVEEDTGLYCEFCFEQYLAPMCHKCSHKIKGVRPEDQIQLSISAKYIIGIMSVRKLIR